MSDTTLAGAPREERPDRDADSLETGSLAERGPFLPLLLTRLRSLWPWIVLSCVTFIGWHELRQVDVSLVRSVLRGTGADVALSLLFVTGLNLAVAGLYDVAALGTLARPPRAASRWSTGVLSFAWSNFLTIGPLAGPALRLWLYRPLGVDAERARSALTQILAAFSAALLGWSSAVALPLPQRLDSCGVRLALGVPFSMLAAWLLHSLPRLSFSPPIVRRWEGRPVALAAIGAVDWLLAWAVFHLALTGLHGGVELKLSLFAFFVGQLVGLASLIPGGLGSADAFWLAALGGAVGGHDRVLAALLLYRIVYYIVPWAIATLVLAGRLIRAGRRTGAFLRSAIASYAFLCGVVLLASAATPALADRAQFLRRSVPLALVEISHGASVVLGFLLLVISRGLARGYRSSHRLALALFLAGALTTFFKGLDFEEALLSLAAVGSLLVFHRSFTRTGTLRPPVEFMVSVGVFAVVLFTAVGIGSLASLPHAAAIYTRFGYLSHGPRFLRALILLASLAAVGALYFGMRARTPDRLPTPVEIDRALEEVRIYASSTTPMLVAGGDKAIFRAPPDPVNGGGGSAGAVRDRRDGAESPAAAAGASPEGFISYRTAGRFLVAYSDPVCPARGERAILEAFLDFAAAVDREAILYQISAALLPCAHDFGFSFFKLGEEAIVDLLRFDLKGDKAKSWRHAINSVEKAGERFEIVRGEQIRLLLPELREVSNEWLAGKHVAEMCFSIGRFDEDYLMRFPCALVRERSGRIAGFANILEGAAGELSVDLMRYRSGEAGGRPGRNIMDYLFLRLMLHGKEHGFTRFNLGMAPLSSVGLQRRARPFERLAHFFSQHGGHFYNYAGLRRFKEKFDPLWEPRYMAYPRPWDWPLAVTSTAVLIKGGWRGILFPKGDGE